MIFKTYRLIILSALILLSQAAKIKACSMYKITVDGITMVGCNEDAWRTSSRIWFENAKEGERYAAAFTGSRVLSANRTAPQSAMNEAGLVFSRLDAYHPSQGSPLKERKVIKDKIAYLNQIMHQCGSIKEVKDFINQYDHSVFYNDVFIYVDSTGQYLIVEPYQLIEGDEASYVLANFCPSITTNDQARQFDRYKHGEAFINKHGISNSLDYYTALSDTMHVCRSRNGDGTLLTSIWNTQDLLVNLYFYHDYETTVQFDIMAELAKGDHSIYIPELFPTNTEFERLKSYKTPFNMPVLRVALVFVAGFLCLISFLLILSLFKLRYVDNYFRSIMWIGILNFLLTAYIFVLCTNSYIYYFDAPFKHYSSDLISASSYMPFVLVLALIPISIFMYYQLKSNNTSSWIKSLLISNQLIYLLLVCAFVYWGLYSV